jgi:MFS family permease
MVSLVVRMAVATTLTAALLTGTASFGLLLGMAGAYGCADGFFGPASTALLADVVPRGLLAPANALIGGSSSSAAIAAPAVAGVIVATLGPAYGFALQAAVLAVIFQTAMQTSVPAAVLARVTAFDLLGSEVGQPVGYALAGPVGVAVGAHAFLTASAAGMFLAASAFAVLRPLRVKIRRV